MNGSIKNIFLGISWTLVSVSLYGQGYLVGTGQEAYTRLLNGSLPHDIATYGYGHYTNPIDTTYTNPADGIVNGVHSDIKARVITVVHPISRKKLTYVLFDLAFPSENIRRELVERLSMIDPDFESASLVLTATHTHSTPGGHSSYLGYENITPGHRPDVLATIVENTYRAIIDSWENMSPMEAVFSEAAVPYEIPIAYSRSALPAYNSNPEVTDPVDVQENYKATDRVWQMMSFEQDGQMHSMLSLFGAHPNRCCSDIISSDTRGAASDQMEAELPEGGVALFAQNAPGDIDSEGYYRAQTDESDPLISNPEYYSPDGNGNLNYIGTYPRIQREGQFLKDQALATYNNPDEEFIVEGDLDFELIYVDMGSQVMPLGNYAETLNPHDFYINDYFLVPVVGQIAQFFNPQLRHVRTSPPAIGLSAIRSHVEGPEGELLTNLERVMRYARLAAAPFLGNYGRYIFNMYRAQADKHVMLEGGVHKRALGVKMTSPIFGLVANQGIDASLLELRSEAMAGLFNEHTILPQIIPLQIVIIGNVALVNVPGEPGNIAGQRIERLVAEHLSERNIRKVIVNGYSNENTGYIMTPEEYPFQYEPWICGFVLYGKWTEPAFRYNFGKLAQAMLLDPDDRDQVLDRTVQPPEWSDSWYENASYLVPAGR